MTTVCSDDAKHQARWKAFLGKNRLKGPGLGEVVSELRDGLATALGIARGRQADA